MRENAKVSDVDDGLTRRGVIEPEDGVHAGCEFRYRPMSPDQVAEFTDKVRATKTVAREYLEGAKLIERHVLEWSLDVDIDLELMKNPAMHSLILEGLIAILVGRAPSEVDAKN